MPRSGSAWLANFLSSGDCLCIHEPLAYAPTVMGYRVVGGVDTGAAHFIDDIRARMPDLRLYALTRNECDAKASAERLGLPWLEHPVLDLPTYRHDLLFDVGYLRELWTEMCGAGFDEHRTRQLLGLNVQRDIPKLTALLQERFLCLGS